MLCSVFPITFSCLPQSFLRLCFKISYSGTFFPVSCNFAHQDLAQFYLISANYEYRSLKIPIVHTLASCPTRHHIIPPSPCVLFLLASLCLSFQTMMWATESTSVCLLFHVIFLPLAILSLPNQIAWHPYFPADTSTYRLPDLFCFPQF
jgi:hypothetical protein